MTKYQSIVEAARKVHLAEFELSNAMALPEPPVTRELGAQFAVCYKTMILVAQAIEASTETNKSLNDWHRVFSVAGETSKQTWERMAEDLRNEADNLDKCMKITSATTDLQPSDPAVVKIRELQKMIEEMERDHNTTCHHLADAMEYIRQLKASVKRCVCDWTLRDHSGKLPADSFGAAVVKALDIPTKAELERTCGISAIGTAENKIEGEKPVDDSPSLPQTLENYRNRFVTLALDRNRLLEACKDLVEGGECNCKNEVDPDAYTQGRRCVWCNGTTAIVLSEANSSMPPVEPLIAQARELLEPKPPISETKGSKHE